MGEFPYRLQVMASYDYWRNRLSDPFGRIGTNLPKSTDDRNHSVFGRVASAVELRDWLELTTIASGRYYARKPFDELALRQDPDSERLTLSGTVETNFHGRVGNALFELRPSVLVSWTRASVRRFNDFGVEQSTDSNQVLPTFRVAGVVSPIDWLAVRGSVSSGFRLPTVLELFGNQGTIRGNPELIAESSVAYDAAVIAQGRAGVFSGYASVGFFLNNIDNQIRFRRTSQFTIIFENISSGRSLGVESEVRANITEHFALFGELTWTQTRDNTTGNQLPGQPQLVAFVRPEVHSGELSRAVSDLLAFFEGDAHRRQLCRAGEPHRDSGANSDVGRARRVVPREPTRARLSRRRLARRSWAGPAWFPGSRSALQRSIELSTRVVTRRRLDFAQRTPHRRRSAWVELGELMVCSPREIGQWGYPSAERGSR